MIKIEIYMNSIYIYKKKKIIHSYFSSFHKKIFYFKNMIDRLFQKEKIR